MSMLKIKIIISVLMCGLIFLFLLAPYIRRDKNRIELLRRSAPLPLAYFIILEFAKYTAESWITATVFDIATLIGFVLFAFSFLFQMYRRETVEKHAAMQP